MFIKYKNTIAFVCLTVMFLFKFVAVHSYLHAAQHHSYVDCDYPFDCEAQSDHQEKACETCRHIFEATLSPFMLELSPAIDDLAILMPAKVTQKLSKLLFIKDFFVSDLSNRPPPFFS